MWKPLDMKELKLAWARPWKHAVHHEHTPGCPRSHEKEQFSPLLLTEPAESLCEAVSLV